MVGARSATSDQSLMDVSRPKAALPARRRKPLSEAHWIWFAPVIGLLLLVVLYPTLFVVWMSFHTTHFFELKEFVGLRNYIEVLSSGTFIDISKTSLLYVFGSLLLVIPLGLAAALAFDNVGATGRVLRVVGLFPYTLSMAVVGTIWLWMLNPSFGPLTYIMKSMGIKPGLLLGDPNLALLLVIIVTVWWTFPYVMVLMSAALQAVPKDLYEAVDIDGGGIVAKFRYVTIPEILPALGSTMLTLGILYLTLVTLVIVLTGGGPLGTTTTWSFAIFRETVQAENIAPAAAMSVIVLTVNILLGALYVHLTGRISA